LSSDSAEQLCGPSAVLLCSWVFAVFVYWGIVSLPCLFLWGKVRVPSADSLLSAYYDGLLIVFQFFSIVRMLLTG
jgi:hypothetical protein